MLLKRLCQLEPQATTSIVPNQKSFAIARRHFKEPNGGEIQQHGSREELNGSSSDQ
jgi:hypothetical protein